MDIDNTISDSDDNNDDNKCVILLILQLLTKHWRLYGFRMWLAES